MQVISILPDHIANQIAAGEVVERPANVVKELLENSLDAKASQITVEFKNGGKSLIFVRDNGLGMRPGDAELCFQRHATSKLSSMDDLLSLHSFGFRGEALPSIASVSKVTLQTRHAEDSIGTELRLLGGKIEEKRPCAHAIGTTFTVEQLFYNIPARRKFLRAETTESAHIINWVRLYALAYPSVHFILKEEGHTIFTSPVCHSLEERVNEIWPRRGSKTWIALRRRQHALELSGLICPPGQGYAGGQEIFIFVNDRPISSLFLMGIIRESYRAFLPPKTYPSLFLFLKVPPQDLDVNVHPAKREVRFKNEQVVRRFVLESLLETLKSYAAEAKLQPLHKPSTEGQTGGAKLEQPGEANGEVVSQVAIGAKPTPVSESAFGFDKKGEISVLRKASFELADTAPPFPKTDKPASDPPMGMSQRAAFTKTSFNVFSNRDLVASQSANQVIAPKERGASLPKNWRFLAVWQKNYVLFESENKLIFFDRQAAHRRIVYEKVRKQLASQALALQALLIPRLFDLPPLKADHVNQNVDFLNAKGFCVLRHMQPHTFLLEAVPAWIAEGNEDAYLESLFEAIETQGKLEDADWCYDRLAQLVAKRAITENALSETSSELLREQLFECANALTDPEGQPIWREMTLTDIQNRFQWAR